MGLSANYESSPRSCLSTEDYREQCKLQNYYKNIGNNRRKIDPRLVLFKFTLFWWLWKIYRVRR